MFGDVDAAAMDVNVQEVSYGGKHYPVRNGRAVGLSAWTIKVILWELAELNFRYELLALDHVAAAHEWKEVDADINRKPLVSAVFLPGKCFTVEDPFQSENMYIVEDDDLHANHQAMENLRKLMVDWRFCPSALKHPLPADPYGLSAQQLRHQLRVFYCVSFYQFFGRPPILPHQTAPHSLSYVIPAIHRLSIHY